MPLLREMVNVEKVWRKVREMVARQFEVDDVGSIQDSTTCHDLDADGAELLDLLEKLRAEFKIPVLELHEIEELKGDFAKREALTVGQIVSRICSQLDVLYD